MNDPKSIHKRFLDYRDKHVSFGRKMTQVDLPTFTTLDAEYYDLRAKGAARDDDQEARIEELAHLLHRD